jgi:Skp family chaperone for outer membrane proteins
MKRINLLAATFVFAALFSVSAFAQAAAPGATKIGWIETGMFGDDKEGITKYNNAVKALEAEMRPQVTYLQGLQTKLKTISEDLAKMQNPQVPVNQQAAAAKQEEGQRLQREFEFKKKEYDAALEAGSNRVLGPVSADIGKAIQEFAKAKGYSVVLDIDKLAQANIILALDQSANITKEFITFYNARPASTATTATPR